MKNLFKITVLSIFAITCLSASSLSAISESVKTKVSNSSIENFDCNYGQCNATAKSTGNRCLHCVSNSGDLYCWQHQ